MKSKLQQKIWDEEGFRPNMYLDTLHVPTIGVGFNLETILMPKHVARVWLDSILCDLLSELSASHDWFIELNEARQIVIVDMCYQMGVAGMLKFKKMIDALKAEKWEVAANELMDSRYADQTQNRAMRNAEILRTGEMT